MSTGTPPFRGPSAVAVLRQVSDDKPAPLRATCPDVPDGTAAIVERLMAKDPDDRIQSAAELANMLDRLAAGPGSADVATILGRKPSPVAPRLRGWLSARRILAASLVVLAIGVGFGSWLSQLPEGLRDIVPEKARKKAMVDFRNGLEKYPALTTNGPDVENILKTEPNGFRKATLPAGRDDTRVRFESGMRTNPAIRIVLDGESAGCQHAAPSIRRGVVFEWSPRLAVFAKAGLDLPGSRGIFSAPQGAGSGGWTRRTSTLDNRAAGLGASSFLWEARVAESGPVRELQYFAAEEGGEYLLIWCGWVGDVTMVG